MEILQVNEDQQKKLATVLKNFRIQLFEYIVDEDKLVVYMMISFILREQ